VRIARLATQSGLFPVFEAEHGEVVATTPIRQRVRVEEYLKLQSRFGHLFSPIRREDVINHLQSNADRNIARYNLVNDDTKNADLSDKGVM
jgi:pyruvate ferredoxin oxidoreductase beta subunit